MEKTILAKGQKIRAVLFYLSVMVFIIGLPLILSYALGYKFDYRKMRLVKVGLIVLRTQPEGADVYLNGVLLKDKTPLSVNELLPGEYSLEARLKDCFPWKSRVEVGEGKVTRFENIVFFPVVPNIAKLNDRAVASFVFDEKRGLLYYFDEDSDSIYQTDLSGDNRKWVGKYYILKPPPSALKVSPDGKRIAYFNRRSIAVSLLSPLNGPLPKEDVLLFSDLPKSPLDIFWLSNSQYLVILTPKSIEILEVRFDAKPIPLVELNRKDARAFYESEGDALYFQDMQKGADGKNYDNVYKLNLGRSIFNIPELKDFFNNQAINATQ